ncbi:DUF402 domain-containing protein [Corynebacterium heidelbergense]|uniref:DUF402 domain-containing protein n=1 Tax=Corynebacterium heidelbergense TaxID=2055947 RepID=A0A364V5D2_9CORY|nr:DUF402 domain-containing protein [Corynebacterium heidelbergense]RAV31842.1 hypothetical protein DLJ54_06225 [Corynebacterium heidelbergense]
MPPELHPVKTETLDLDHMINVDPKGFRRTVDSFEVSTTPAGPALFMARGADHPKFNYLQSWFIPHLDIRVTDFHMRPGHETNQQLYVDIAVTTPPAGFDGSLREAAAGAGEDAASARETSGRCRENAAGAPEGVPGTGEDAASAQEGVWRYRDLYVDVVTFRGGHPQVLDLDELALALEADYVDATEVSRALAATQRVLDGLHTFGSVEGWIEHEGLRLTWCTPRIEEDSGHR